MKNGKMIKILICLIVSTFICEIFVGINRSVAVYATDNKSAVESIIKPESVSYSETNIEHQNYYYGTWHEAWTYVINHADVIRSYLVKTNEAGYMRFETDKSGDYTVSYYTSDFKLNKTVSIDKELDIFGGFYAGTDGYYIMSGQGNPDESDSVECFRITKYNKSWSRLSSVGLHACNTTIPFRAGSLRVAEYGDYLIIRTSHQMYKSAKDGKNHQANVTIEYSKSASKITDSYTDVMNTGYGYVSHSFNQFIHIEDGKIVALDHGDAYPRSIVMIKYNNTMTSGKFVPTYYNRCTAIDVMPFEGEIGDNYTGASVGGFEISDSSYLIAGVSQKNFWDTQNSTFSRRDVFLSVVSKADNSVKTNYLTDLKTKNITANNPQFVKVNNDRFVLMWTERNMSDGWMNYSGLIKYAVFDGEGNLIGDIRQGVGYLSDCKPIIDNGRIVWYVYNNDKTVFYSLDLVSYEIQQNDGRNKGDTNGDGSADIADALMISRADAGLIKLASFEKDVSDVNGDESVDIADALMIARYDAGLIHNL